MLILLLKAILSSIPSSHSILATIKIMSENSFAPPESFVKLVRNGLLQLKQGKPSDLEELLYIVRLRHSKEAQQMGAVRYGVTKAIDQLELQDPEAAAVLRQRYLDRKSIQEIVSITHRSQASVHRDLRLAAEKLADILWQHEIEEHRNYERIQLRRLEPPTYDQLFGVDDIAQKLFDLLVDPAGPTPVMLVGSGGIGKTALADHLSRKIIQAHVFTGIGWISMRPQISLWDVRPFFTADSPEHAIEQLFERLTAQLLGEKYVPSPFDLDKALDRLEIFLNRSNHFIVIDNLEVFEPEETLLTILRRFTPYTKFLLTSRKSPTVYPDVYPVRIPPINAEASLALLRHEARKRNVVSLIHARDEDLMTIYDTVGGNPLALKLVVGQASYHALSTVLEDIQLARGKTVQDLYDYLYRWAWSNLSEPEQKIFLAMPLLPPEGGDFEQIVAITGMDEDTVHDALEKLVSRSLVDVIPGLEQSTYAVHGLTRTFVQEQAAKWR